MERFGDEILAGARLTGSKVTEAEISSAELLTRLRWRFGGAGSGGHLWEALKESTSVQHADGWRWPAEFASGAACLLAFNPGDERRVFSFEDGAELERVLGECSGFEFYVTNESTNYLLVFNHHDFLIAAGSAMAWLAATDRGRVKSSMSEVDIDILVNQIAQGVKEPGELVTVAGRSTEDDVRTLLRRVNALAEQAGLRADDVPAAIVSAGVNPRRSAAVMLTKGQVAEQLGRISTLPGSELEDGLRLSLALLKIADTRRRAERCHRGCAHWWHRDLSNDLVVARLRSELRLASRH